MTSSLYVVIPCYNEQEILKETATQVHRKLKQLIKDNLVSENSRIVFVDDGSKDDTWKIIEKLHAKNKTFIGLKLSRNRGHQNALLAGLFFAKEKADIVISMDADLQDDINVIDDFIREYHNGYDIVYGVRSSRDSDSKFKRKSARSFYSLMRGMGVELVYDHADFRLMSSRALDELAKYSEVNLFLRGIIPLIGYPATTVSYIRKERTAGESKYPLKKMLSFALDGITSFSIKPIRFVFILGTVFFFVSLAFLLYVFAQKVLGHTVEGWSFIACSLWFIGGVQMMSIGLLGEYIGKVYAETKARPRYVIQDTLE